MHELLVQFAHVSRFTSALALTITLGSLVRASAQPTITNQPQDQFVNAGESAALSVAASGTPLADATSAVLQFTNPAQLPAW